MPGSTLLEKVKVLDLTDERGYLCGRILADLGADVIKIEKPGGDAGRSIPPLIEQGSDAGLSLVWLAFNANKRGVTLDLASERGADIFKRLVKSADVIVESFHPGWLDRYGLGFKEISGLNPRCVLTSITPFGQTGPYRDYQGSDLICFAQSGWLNLCGDPERPPVRIAAPQAFLNAGAEAAMGTMFALWGRDRTGKGQHVDVSAQQSMIVNSFQAVSFWELNKVILKRAGPYRTGLTAGVRQRQTWPCKGGFINFSIIGGKAGSKTNASLIQWMKSEGITIQGLEDWDWETFDMATVTQEQLGLMDQAFSRFFLTHTKDELYEGALKRAIMLCPVNNVADMVASPQLAARDFWDTPGERNGAALKFPGKVIDPSQADVGIRVEAPGIGQHNADVYVGELAIRPDELKKLAQAGVI